MADQYLYNINRRQRASCLRLSEAQTTWNKTLFDVALWADNWQLPRAKQDLVGKENLNTSTVLDDLLYFQVVLSGQLMCLSHASLRLDEVYYFSALVHNITRNTPTFLSSCYPGTQTLLFLTQGNDGLWHGNTENPVRSCLKLWKYINVLEIYMWVWGKRVTVKSAWRIKRWFFFSFWATKKANNDTERDRNGVVDWRRRVKCQGLLLITRMAFSNNWMDLWKGCRIHPLSYAHKLYKKHIVSKDLVTHTKKAGNVLDTHAIHQTLSCPG